MVQCAKRQKLIHLVVEVLEGVDQYGQSLKLTGGRLKYCDVQIWSGQSNILFDSYRALQTIFMFQIC